MNVALTEEMRSAGESLVRELDRRKFSAKAAFWLYATEQNDWRLVVATPQVRTFGPKKIYKMLQQTIAKMDSPLKLSSIELVDTKDPLIRSLSSAIRTGGDISGIRLSQDTINGHFIDDAYIYRMAA